MEETGRIIALKSKENPESPLLLTEREYLCTAEMVDHSFYNLTNELRVMVSGRQCSSMEMLMVLATLKTMPEIMTKLPMELNESVSEVVLGEIELSMVTLLACGTHSTDPEREVIFSAARNKFEERAKKVALKALGGILQVVTGAAASGPFGGTA